MITQAQKTMLQVQKVDVWAGSIEDRAGGLRDKLKPLSDAGADLGFVIARRSPGQPGRGEVCLTPVKGTKQLNAARKAGLHKTEHTHTLRAVGPDRPGLGAELTDALAEAGLSMHGLSAASLGDQCVVYMSFDSADEANKAARAAQDVRV